uniref:Uncharacterized protein n=1 Tax=viral metagenome TaxID=1070528 RepID=A0A6C0L0Z3_9ZZZZ
MGFVGKYHATAKGVMKWAESELEHVGRIAAVENPDIQYSYAQSTVNGMMHLRDALFELVNDPDYKEKKTDLLRTHDQVVRALKHLIKDYDVNLNDIRKFNTRGVLSGFNYLENNTKKNNNKKTVKNNNNVIKNKNNNNNTRKNNNKQYGG